MRVSNIRAKKGSISMLMLLLVLPLISCDDKNECIDLYVQPYYDIMDMAYVNHYQYYSTKNGSLEFSPWPAGMTSYPCDSLAMYFMTPSDKLNYHSFNTNSFGFSLFPSAYACNSQQHGYAGTHEKIDEIHIYSDAPFDERHPVWYDLADLVKIFAYTTDGNNKWERLEDYNANSPYEAPKRFYLMFTQKPTLSKTHRFRVRYVMKGEEGGDSEFYVVDTGVITLR